MNRYKGDNVIRFKEREFIISWLRKESERINQGPEAATYVHYLISLSNTLALMPVEADR